MRTALLTAIAISMALLFSASANAKRVRFCLGKSEHLERLKETNLADRSGNRLDISRMHPYYCFIAPVYVSNDGLVLQPVGSEDRYYPMPHHDLIPEMQIKGLLPMPLPVSRLTWLEIIFGYSLWYIAIAIGGVYLWLYVRRRKSAA